jgi:hypothetical protein
MNTLFLIRALLPPAAIENHAAPEYMPIWSVVCLTITTDADSVITTETEIASGLDLGDAMQMLSKALTEYVTR